MKKQKCPKCSSQCIQDAELVIFACNTENGTYFNQSELCKERVKNAKLKKQVERMKERAESAEWAVKELQKTVTKLRNPKF